MQTPEHETVTTWLHGQGETTEVVYFGDSEFILGRRLRQAAFEVVYRQEDDDLVIADFRACKEGQEAGAVAGFIRFVHRMEREVPGLRRVRGHFVRSATRPALNALRERLSRILEGQGAHWENIDADAWLVYPTGRRNVAL